MSRPIFNRTSNGDLYAIGLGSILNDGMRVWDPGYAMSKDPLVWEKAQQDAVVSGAIERSLLDVAGKSWSVVPTGEGDPAAALKASIADALFRHIPGFSNARRNLAEARFTGSAFARITGQFEVLDIAGLGRRRWWVPDRLIDVDRRRLRAYTDRTEDGIYAWRWEFYHVAAKQWIAHDDKTMPMIRHIYTDRESSLGYGRGIMDAVYYALWVRTQLWKLALQGASRWAQGLLIGKVNLEASGDTGQTNEDMRNEMRDNLREMLGDNVLVVGAGDEVEVKTGGMEGHQIVDGLLTRAERELITRIEGSPLSTMGGDGGSRALGQEHGVEQHSQRRFDRESLSESITRLVDFTMDMNRPVLMEIDRRLAEAPNGRFDIQDQRVEDPAADMDMVEKATRVGVRLSQREVYDRIGWRMPEGDEPVVEAPQGGGGDGGGLESLLGGAMAHGVGATTKGKALAAAVFDESKHPTDDEDPEGHGSDEPAEGEVQ